MRVIYGVCGAGAGHVHRQIPVIDALLAGGAQLTFCAHDRSAEVLQFRYPQVPLLRTRPVWLAGAAAGLDLSASADGLSGLELAHNLRVLDELLAAEAPDLVISDYEPVCAQAAYALDRPLVTIDQQSKFLGARWPTLAGLTPVDEQMRLRMFFPRVQARLACSFFAVDGSDATVVAPVLRPLPARTAGQHVTAYVSPQAPPALAAAIAAELDRLRCPVERFGQIGGAAPAEAFLQSVASASALVCTAGHSLLSEAVALGVAVCAVPFGPYEQHLNAHVLSGAGMALGGIDRIADVVEHAPALEAAIADDRHVLLRGDPLADILRVLERVAR